MLKVNYEERISINDIIHKFIFITKSKEVNLYYYTDKIINSKKPGIITIKKRFIINRNYDKNIKSYLDKKEEKKKLENYFEQLNKRFFEIKQNVEDILGKPKSDKLFTELTINNINEIISKYNYECIYDEKNEKLKLLLIEYMHIVKNASYIKNKI